MSGGAVIVSASMSLNEVGSDIDGDAANDYLGRSVSLSSDGTIVAIGAHGNDGNGSNSGHVRVFEWDGTAWVQKGSDIEGEAASDQSGFATSLSSDGAIVAIGAHGNDGNGSNSGHVRVFEWDGTAWVQKGSDIEGEAAEDSSGFATSLSSDGTIVAIGAERNDGNGSNSGHVRVYEWSGDTWVQKGATLMAKSQRTHRGSRCRCHLTAPSSRSARSETTETGATRVMSVSMNGPATRGFKKATTLTAKPQTTTRDGRCRCHLTAPSSQSARTKPRKQLPSRSCPCL